MSWGQAGLAVLLSTAAVAWPLDASATRDAGQSSNAGELRPVAYASNPPGITVKPGKEGAVATGKQTKRHRLSVEPPKPKRRSKGKKQTLNTKGPLNQHDSRPPRSRLKKGVRLNIGMCGRVQPDGVVPGPDWCQPVIPGRPGAPERPTPPTPTVVRPRPEDVTWDQVFNESKTVLFKKLTVHVQPKGRTLVNMDTIVYTDKVDVLTYTVPILGFPVQVQATPARYIWSFGDRTSKATYSPGAPYPSKEITHKYLKRGDVRLSVTVE